MATSATAIAETLTERELARQLATLVYAGVRPVTTGTALQAAAWRNALGRLGLFPPLFVVHDLGALLARPAEWGRWEPAGPGGGLDAALRARYESFLAAASASESLRALGATVLRDEVIAVLLARLLGDVCRSWTGPTTDRATDRTMERLAPTLPLTSPLFADNVASLARATRPEWALSFLQHLLAQEGSLLVRIDQLDLGPVRLLGYFPPGAVPPDLVDLHQLLNTPGAADVVDFCLQLLPSLLETKRTGAPQRFTIDGYASIERRGSPDALLPSELAHDPEVFELKAISQELLYYGHERPHEGTRRVHGILVDASASMRGVREVFARGLALALAKKLFLSGTEVWLRFFDSRLHRRVDVAGLGGHELPYLLCFRSERGRNYGRVFGDLLLELQRERVRVRREVAVTMITHAECHIPPELVEALGKEAALYGVFVLPSQPLSLDYLPLLRGHHVVTAEALGQPNEKRRRALEIVREVLEVGRSLRSRL